MKFKAVIFDADGTLINSLEDSADAINATLEHFGFPTHDTEKYKHFLGDGMENAVRRTLPEEKRHDEALVRQCLASARHEYGRRWNLKTHPYEGVPDLLDSLVRLGVSMSILSNKPDEFMMRIVSEFLPRWHFEQVVGERPLIPRKPDPTSALRIASACGTLPSEFLYLGDTGTDMKTANAAGMFAAGALWGFRDAAELLMSGARVLIKNPAELTALL